MMTMMYVQLPCLFFQTRQDSSVKNKKREVKEYYSFPLLLLLLLLFSVWCRKASKIYAFLHATFTTTKFNMDDGKIRQDARIECKMFKKTCLGVFVALSFFPFMSSYSFVTIYFSLEKPEEWNYYYCCYSHYLFER